MATRDECFNAVIGFTLGGICSELTFVETRVTGGVTIDNNGRFDVYPGRCSFGTFSGIQVGGLRVSTVTYSTKGCSYWKPDSNHIIFRHTFEVAPVYSSHVGLFHQGWIQLKFDRQGHYVVQDSGTF